MRGIRVWPRLLGLRPAVVERVRIGSDGEVIVSARPAFRERDRYGGVPAPSPGLISAGPPAVACTRPRHDVRVR
jgi:hypothetical protein